MTSDSLQAPTGNGVAPARGGTTGAAMRLAIVVRSLAPYRNRLYDGVAQELGATGEVTIFTGDAGSVANYQWDAETLRLDRASVVCVPAIRGKSGFLHRDWTNPLLWKKLSEFNPTHVWFHEFSLYVLLGLVWGRLHGHPCYVSTDIGDRFRSLYTICHKGMQDFFKRRCHGVIACTQDAFDTARRLRLPAVFVPHAIDTNEFVPGNRTAAAADGKVRVLQVGILNERKGIDLLLQAFRKCVNAGVASLELTLLGGGAHAWARGLIESLGLGEHVRIRDFVQGPELVEAYQQADIFVLASREDTYAVVAHEAAACGLPLVISRHAGASETLVEEGRNGFVVDPANADEFSRAILQLASNADLRQKCGKHSRILAERFSAQECARRTARWLREPS